MRIITLVSLVIIIFTIAGCETKYSVITNEGIVDMPLSKALKQAQTAQELYPLLSDAITLEDRQLIEQRIEQLQGYPIPDDKRNYGLSEDIIHEQTQRRIVYVRTHKLDERTKQIILSGGYVEGMTKEQFIASRGEPVQSRLIKSENETIEVLVEGLLSQKSFYFVNGLLSHWE